MCGIAGWLGPPLPREASADLSRRLHHRGPDGEGIEVWPEATLVHRRLSIIDLSPAGAQPMANEDGTVWVVFNGEIYNHGELRRELEARGHRFRGRSDSEVIPHLYEEEGDGFVERLRGMFAVALLDRSRRRMVLARDRYGIKPLFWAAATDRLAFCSEIAPLADVPGVDRRPDRQAIHDLAALFYIPAPATLLRGVRAVCPGEILACELGADGPRWTARSYHQPELAPDETLTLESAACRAAELIDRAVGRQLESDVPLGAFLSGGIDSSLVSGSAQAALPGGVETFNVRFGDVEFDETWAAHAVAGHIGSRHRTLEMNGATGSWDTVIDLLRHAGQPFPDSSLIPSNAVCRLMRRHVTVALSGDGGDEGFGGYPTFVQIGKIARIRRAPAPLLLGAGAAARALARTGLMGEHLGRRLSEVARQDAVGIVEDQIRWVREPEHRRLCQEELEPVRRHFEPRWEHGLSPGAAPGERLSALLTEATVRLPMANDFLFKVDAASMRESLEVRVPMLDEDLVSFGFTLPHRLKVAAGRAKAVLREVAARRLPPAVASKPKWGFGLPVDRWVDGEFRARLRETLLGRESVLPAYFRPAVYEPWVDDFCAGRVSPGLARFAHYQRIFMLLSVQVAIEGLTRPRTRSAAPHETA